MCISPLCAQIHFTNLKAFIEEILNHNRMLAFMTEEYQKKLKEEDESPRESQDDKQLVCLEYIPDYCLLTKCS